MKEVYKGIDKIEKKLGLKDSNINLLEICQEQFEIKQELTIVGNKIFLLGNEKLRLSQSIARLEKEKDKIFIDKGLKFVKPLKKEDAKDE